MSHPLSRSFARCADAQTTVDWLLRHGAEVCQTGLGTVQLMSWKRGHLEIKAQLGLDQDFLNR
jgi:hypothetical protein